MTDDRETGEGRCQYRCEVCGEACCTEPATGASGLCFLHDRDLSPELQEAAARQAGSDSLKAHVTAKAQRGETLHGVLLRAADLRGAWLPEADLRGADFAEAKMEKANLAGADLRGANFYNADLHLALMWRSKLRDACMDWADLHGVRGLFPADCRDIKPSIPGYRSIKRMFLAAERRDEASETAFWEKRQQKRDLHRQAKSMPFWSAARIGVRIRWLVLILLEIICGYFERPWRSVVSLLVVIVLCGFAYSLGDAVERPTDDNTIAAGSMNWKPAPISLGEGMYFSAVTFTTLGYGDFRPKPGFWRLIAATEAFLGALLLSVFMVTLAHRYVGR